MPFSEALLELIACPANGDDLLLDQQQLVSTQGKTYPFVGGVPWLLPNPENSLLDWGIKLNHFNQVILTEVKQLESELKHAQGATQQRLEKLLDGKQKFIARIAEFMMPVVQNARAANKNIYEALRDRAPNTQNLLSYEANLYRDWVWGEEENKLTADIVLNAFGDIRPKNLAVLGAGAGRLALDVHDALSPEHTVATDINPLLVIAAQCLLSGQSFSMVEFPLHPRKLDYVAVEHQLQGAHQPENFHFLFSDSSQPSFKKGAFDAVLTPWFVDIQPLEFGRFLKQLNQYLSIGGTWVNFGSLVFNQKRDSLCYSIDEIRGIAEQQGFNIEDIEEHEIPYLKSPYNAGFRMERVWTWRAKKTADVKAVNRPQNLPSWLLDDKQPVPQAQYFQQFSFTHRVYAQLAAEVDGRTSLLKIAKKLAKQNRVEDEEALKMVKDFFTDLYQQNN